MSWLGIAIFVAFSLGLAWFMRREPRARRELPTNLGEWVRQEAARDEPEPTYLETRLWLYEGGLLRSHRLVEQSRLRAERDGRIVRVLPERVVDTWRQ